MSNDQKFVTLSDKVMHEIRRDIFNGELEPGQKLIITELQKRYNVGGSPLREALVQLSWRNFLVMVPQRGFWVANVSLKELRNIISTRRALSKIALQNAVADFNEESELDILTSYHKLSRLDPDSPTFDYNEWEVRHKQFHLTLLGCTGADYL